MPTPWWSTDAGIDFFDKLALHLIGYEIMHLCVVIISTL